MLFSIEKNLCKPRDERNNMYCNLMEADILNSNMVEYMGIRAHIHINRHQESALSRHLFRVFKQPVDGGFNLQHRQSVSVFSTTCQSPLLPVIDCWTSSLFERFTKSLKSIKRHEPQSTMARCIVMLVECKEKQFSATSIN